MGTVLKKQIEKYLKVCSVYLQNVFLKFRNSAQTLHKFVGKPFNENKMHGNSDAIVF